MPNAYRYASVREIHEAYLTGQATVTEVVDEFLSLIDRYNPYLHAVIEINPDVREIAAKLDKTLAALRADLHQKDTPTPRTLPLLFGIPVLLKDNIATGDKLHTSAGAAALGDLLAPNDAPCAKNLRKAGVVILGKANLSEFANYYTEDNPNGWSARGGQTIHPYEPVPKDLSVFELGKYKQEEHFDPSGSSSGSAVATAAGLCTAAVGTETSGSILSPSACNGLIGCKPTAGLVSNEAVIPISPTLDTPGPMARTADDCAVLLTALAGLSEEAFSQQYPDEALSLPGLKFGVILPRNKEERGKWDPTDEEYAIFDAFLEKMEKAGVILMRGADRGTSDGIMDLMKYEIKGSINAFLAWANREGERTKMHSLTDILDYVHAHPECSPYGHTLLETRDKDTSDRMDEPGYLEALHKREGAQAKMAAYFDENQLDAIISVDFPGFAPFGGFPAVTLPLGFRADGYPVAAFLYARPGQDFRLIRIVKALAALQPPMPHPNI